MTNFDLRLSAERLLDKLTELGTIGATPEGGVCRVALTDEDKFGRDLVCRWMTELGLTIRIDQLGNIFAIRAGLESLSPIMTGSHIDSVVNGGHLDGCLGVLAGLEIVQTLNDAKIETNRPLVVAAFTNEEGARFQPDMLGSLVHVGGYDLETALRTTDDNGQVLGEELRRIDYAGDLDCGEIIPSAFVELHIEQGPVLEQEGITLGVVENLQGICWTEITFSGQANHAGTTPMYLRKDAGYCAAALASFAHDLAANLGETQVATVGVIELKPNIINVIPNSARITVDLRNADNAILTEAERQLHEYLVNLSNAEGVEFETKQLARFDPVDFNEDIVHLIAQKARVLGHSYRRMTSGAGHDAQMMSRICPSAMIFVPSINGISHNPAEDTKPDDILAGANTLLHTLIELANG